MIHLDFDLSIVVGLKYKYYSTMIFISELLQFDISSENVNRNDYILGFVVVVVFVGVVVIDVVVERFVVVVEIVALIKE